MTFGQTAGEQIPELARLQRLLLIAGAAGGAISVVGLLVNPAQFFQSYLIGYMLVLGATLGCLALGMIHQLSGGAWGVLVRRPMGAAIARPPCSHRAVPADRVRHAPPLRMDARGRGRGRPDSARQAALSQHPFFLARAAIYFAAWNASPTF